MWVRGQSRHRRAILSALAAVGEAGMTLLALGVAVDLPEARVQAALDRLIRSGRVRRGRVAAAVVPGQQAPCYLLASTAVPRPALTVRMPAQLSRSTATDPQGPSVAPHPPTTPRPSATPRSAATPRTAPAPRSAPSA